MSPGANREVDLHLSQAKTDRLHNYLTSVRSPPDSMMVSELDGFLTGVVIGPSLVPPSEWLPQVWGGGQPEFADTTEAQDVLGAIMARYNEILREVENGDPNPVYWVAKNDIVITTEWALGFREAMRLRWGEWGPLFRSKAHNTALVPIFFLCDDETMKDFPKVDVDALGTFLKEAPGVIPACILEIAAFWRRRRRARPGNLKTDRVAAAARIATKVGRNDPCPCGSGVKFKKCCGA